MIWFALRGSIIKKLMVESLITPADGKEKITRWVKMGKRVKLLSDEGHNGGRSQEHDQK